MDESATEIASTVAKVALESNSENQDVQPTACVASISTVVQSSIQDAFYKFSNLLLGHSYLYPFNCIGHLFLSVGFIVSIWLYELST